MTLQNSGHDSLAGGPIMLQTGWPHDPAKNSARWPHDPANRHHRHRPNARAAPHRRSELQRKSAFCKRDRQDLGGPAAARLCVFHDPRRCTECLIDRLCAREDGPDIRIDGHRVDVRQVSVRTAPRTTEVVFGQRFVESDAASCLLRWLLQTFSSRIGWPRARADDSPIPYALSSGGKDAPGARAARSAGGVHQGLRLRWSEPRS